MADSGTYTDDTMQSRRRLADAMLQQGAQYSPIAHSYQGLARLANALFGGMAVNDLKKEAEAKDKSYSDDLLRSLDATGGAAPAAPATSTAKAPSNLTEFIKGREGFNAQPYADHKQTSSGYGTVAQPGDAPLTQEEASKRLDVEVGKARQLVQSFGVKLTPQQEDALTDLTYNAGTAWMSSGLGEAVKAGDWPRAAELFKQYNKAGGQVQPGLVSRREALAGNFTAESPNSAAQPVSPGAGQTTQPTQNAASESATASQALSGVSPQARARIEALLNSPDHRLKAMGAKLVQGIIAKSMETPKVESLAPGAVAHVNGRVILRNEPRDQVVPEGGTVLRDGKPIFKADPKPEKPPAGFEWADPNDKSKGLSAIPGGPGEHISSEVAGRLALMKSAREGIAKTRGVYEKAWSGKEYLEQGAANLPIIGDLAIASGDVGIAQREIRSGVEAALRVMTGAAAPETEVARYAQMFTPGASDTIESAKQKLDNLDAFMKNAEEMATRGRRPTKPGVDQGGWKDLGNGVRIREKS